MYSKKRVSMLVVLVVISIIGISIVSAGWFSDLFKIGKSDEGLEGELPSASVPATVTLANAPPTIVAFLPVRDVTKTNAQIPATPDGQVLPQAGDVVYAVFRFVAQDPDGLTDLPTAPTIGNTAANNEIEVSMTSPSAGIRCSPPYSSCRIRSASTGVMPTGVTAACAGVTCVGDSDCPDPSAGTKQRKYTCYVQMQYYDEPVTVTPPTAGSQMWSISARIEDNAGNSASANSGTWAFAAGNYIWYNTVTEGDIAPTESVVWTSLNPTALDNPGDDGNTGDTGTGLTLRNRGNKAITSIDLKPQNLKGTLIFDARLLATAFGVGTVVGSGTGGGAGACDVSVGGGSSPWEGIQLTGGVTISNYPRTITYIADGTDAADLYFCIWPAVSSGYLTGQTDKIYQATGGTPPYGEGNYWELIFNSA